MNFNVDSTTLYADLMSASGFVWGFVGVLISFFFMMRLLVITEADAKLPLVVGWLLRFLFCLFNTLVLTFSVDAFEFEAYVLSQFPIGDIMAEFGVNSGFYTWFCAVIYHLLGRSPLLLQALNIIFWTIAQHYMVKTARILGAKHNIGVLAWTYALFPAAIFFSTVILREAICIAGIVAGTYFWAYASKNGSIFGYLLSLALFTLAAICHYGCVFLILGVGVIPFLPRKGSAKQSGGFRVFILVASLGVLTSLTFGGMFSALAPALNPETVSVARLGGVVEDGYERGRSDYMDKATATSTANLFWTVPLRILYFMFAPLPWMVQRVSDAAALLDSFIYVVIAFVIFKNRNKIYRNHSAFSALFSTLMAVIVFSFGTLNFGTAMRHRAKFLPVLAAVAIFGYGGGPKGRLVGMPSNRLQLQGGQRSHGKRRETAIAWRPALGALQKNPNILL